MIKDRLIKFSVDAKEFKNILPAILNAAMIKKNIKGNIKRTVLYGVMLNVSLGKLTLVGCDNYQLAYKIFDVSDNVDINTDYTMVIPIPFIKSCIKLIDLKKYKIIDFIINTDNNLIEISSGDLILKSPGCEDMGIAYPYQGIKDLIPTEFTSDIIVNRVHLIKSIEGLNNPTSNKFIKLIPYYDDSRYTPYYGLKASIGLRNFRGEGCKVTTDIKTSKMTLEDTKYLDKNLLLKALKKMKCETLHIQTNCDKLDGIDYNPLVIKPMDKNFTEDTSFTYLLYSVRPDSPE